MADASLESTILAGGHGVWAATPETYASCRFMRLGGDGGGDLIYGYGQTIYATILCRWEVPAAGVLRLTYLDSPAKLRFKGFTPTDESRVRELQYTLTGGDVSGSEDICSAPFQFLWTLQLSEPPWPPGLELPYEVPRVFFGHRQPTDNKA